MNINTLVKLALYAIIYINMAPLTWGQNIVLKPLSVHVQDKVYGVEAANVTCKLYQKVFHKFNLIATAVTNADGRITEFLSVENYKFGVYRIWFGLEDFYYYTYGISTFFSEAQITYENKDGTASHIKLNMTPNWIGRVVCGTAASRKSQRQTGNCNHCMW